MRPEIYRTPQLPTYYIARFNGRIYRFSPARWSDRVELKPSSPAIEKAWFAKANRCVCNDYPQKVFEQLILGPVVAGGERDA